MSYLLDQARAYLGLPTEGAPPPPDWPAALREARAEGLAALLAFRLCEAGDPPDEARAVLMSDFGWTARVDEVLRRIGEDLESRGTRVIVLKGGALARTVYGAFPALRPVSDLDLFVRAGDEAIVHQASAVPGIPVPVDLHRSLLNADRIPTRDLAFRFPEEELWAESLPLPGGPASLRMLGPRHLAPSLAVHALKHSFSRLSWLLDLALVLRDEDPQVVLEGARRAHAERPLACSLWLLEELFGFRTDLRRRLPRLNLVELWYLRRVARRRQSHLLGELLVGFSVPGPLGPLRHLWANLFPPREVLRGLFPGVPDWQLPWRRLAQLARAVRGDAGTGRSARTS